MIIAKNQLNRRLKCRLESLACGDRDFWSFKGRSIREHGHGIFQYPAMMVPQVVRVLLNEVCEVHPEVKTVGDPFSGSGTILTESILKGLNFVGKDINPLAILLCKTKAGPFFIEAMIEKLNILVSRSHSDCKSSVDIDFPGINKWFNPEIQIALSKIRRSILAEPSIWARRFFWIAMCETVRLTSNSRTSTFKLHIRSREDMVARKLEPFSIFEKILSRNNKHLYVLARCLYEQELLKRGRLKSKVSISLGDIRENSYREKLKCDIIITSPPYGDNATTVPYGQSSYLPLQWVDLKDIDTNVDKESLRTTHEIDMRSLGGSKRINAEDMDLLCDISPSFKKYIEHLRKQPDDRAKRVTAFVRDMNNSLAPILSWLHPGGILVWIIGNRKVGGIRVPLDKIVIELLADREVQFILSLKRRIPSKRMAIKNSIADTISNETILVARKAS